MRIGSTLLRIGRVHPQREPERRHHDAAVAEALALRQGQVPGQQEGALEDEENAGEKLGILFRIVLCINAQYSTT